MGKLRDRMLVDLQLSGAKLHTQRACLREAENFTKYFHKSPEQLGWAGDQNSSAHPLWSSILRAQISLLYNALLSETRNIFLLITHL